jgi:hypothetical protein
VNRLLAIVALVVVSAAPTLADATADVKNAFLGLARASAYHITATTAAGPTMSGDFVSPGKMHITAGPIEMIVIDTATYVKVQGAWHQFAFPGADRMTGPFAHIQSYIKSHADISVTDLGPKLVDETTLHAYAVKGGGTDKPATVYLDAGGNLVRIDASEAAGTTVIRFSNLNGPITIVAPI